mgnify:CR=1 FL=1
MFNWIFSKPKTKGDMEKPVYQMADYHNRVYDVFAQRMNEERSELEEIGMRFYGRNQIYSGVSK